MMARTAKFPLVAFVLAAACGSGTGGHAVRFDVRLAPDSASPARFATGTGWAVTLEEACIAVGPIYLFANPPLLAPAEARGGKQLLRTISNWLVPTAHAHGGDAHFNGGEVRGEWVEQIAFDALAPNGVELGTANGLAGAAQSFSLSLLPPRPEAGGNTGCLRGHHAYVRGSADKDGTIVAFEGGLDIENKGTFRSVDGIPLAGTELDDGVRVTVRLRTSAWFDGAHFDRLTERTAEGRFVITPDSQVAAAWLAGARGYTTFSASATRGEGS